MTQAEPFHVLYLAAELPKQSETFVYREVLGLRRRNVEVSVSSVHAPSRNLGDAAADALADEVIQVYPRGKLRLLKDAMLSLLRVSGCRTLLCGLKDAILERDIPLRKRHKVVWQCLAGLALAWRARKLQISHLHSHMAHVPTTISMYAAMAMGVPFSFTGHAADLFRDRCLLTAKLRRAARVMCISQWHRRFYQSIVTIADKRLPVVRCGVDVDRWHAPPASMTSPGILAVGRLVPKKGLDVLLRSVAQLHERGVSVNCTIVGDGPQRSALVQLVQELGVEKQVRLVGALSNDTVCRLMRVHGVFALPCRIDRQQDRDGIPVVLMEAMACGAAVVSGELPTIRELIEHNVNGLLVPPDDVPALTDALHSLLTDPQKRRTLGAAARRTVRDEFSLDLNLERLESALRGSHEHPSTAGSHRPHDVINPPSTPAYPDEAAATFNEAFNVEQRLLPDQPVPR